MSWTPAHIPDLHGRVVIVTGANAGLGKQSARVLADKGAEVVMACRSTDKGEAARAELSDVAERLHVMALDLADLASVAAFAAAFSTRFDRLDILMNNAGIMGTPYFLTRDGFEGQLGVNHLGHFALTGRLLPMLRETGHATVVTVSSEGHRAGRLDLDDLGLDGGFTPFRAYGRSKLANLLFAYALHRRCVAHEASIRSVAAHPGAARTELGRHIEGRWYVRLLRPLLEALVASPERGAVSQLRAATDESLAGVYVGPAGSFGMNGHPVVARSSRASHDEALGEALWRVSEELTGVRYAW